MQFSQFNLAVACLGSSRCQLASLLFGIGFDQPEAAHVLGHIVQWAIAENTRAGAIVDHNGFLRPVNSTGDNPVAVGLQLVVKGIDGGNFVATCRVGLVVDYSDKKSHRNIIVGAGGLTQQKAVNVMKSLAKRLTARVAVVALSLAALTAQPLAAASAASTYAVTLDSNGAASTVRTQAIPASGKHLIAVPFNRDGYQFAGWALSPAGSVRYADKALIKPKSKLKLFAIWNLVVARPTIGLHTIGALLWADEFSGAAGSKINTTNWTSRYCGQEATNSGGACWNNEPQWYTPAAVALDGSAQGNALITTNHVLQAPTNAGQCLASSCQFTSARFDTQGKVSFQYGYIEARIKMPAGGFNWPAFWALGDSISQVGWPNSGEIDIAEEGGNLPMRASSAVHYSTVEQNTCCDNATYDVGEVVNVANYQTDYHTYGMAWTPGRMDFYVDRQLFFSSTRQSIRSTAWPFDSPFFLILNNATGGFGGDYTGWLQSQMSIDYVRAWQVDGQGSVVRH